MTEKSGSGTGGSIEAPPAHIVELAVEVSGWSPCRSKRGVVIFRGENVISHGHNFKPRGFECDASDACKASCRDEAVHAEQAALIAAGGRPTTDGADLLHVKSLDGRLVPSGGPSCVQCSKLIVAYGIAGVWLYHETGWKRYKSAEFHRQSLAAALLTRRDQPEQRTEHWSVEVRRNGENLVTIESNCLSGKPEFSDAEAETIRDAADHLQSFIGTRRDADPAKEPGWQLPTREVCSNYSRPAGVLGGPCLICGASQPEHIKESRMTEQIPTIGRIVHYRLSQDDADQINRRRTTGASIAARMKYGDDPQLKAWPAGAQAHIGNDAKEGDTFPMLITKVWGSTPADSVNGQVFLDGNDVLWTTSVHVGEGPRTFSWPSRT